MITSKEELKKVVNKEVEDIWVIDPHAHVFPKNFKNSLVWGIDELLTDNHLVSEYLEFNVVDKAEFIMLPKEQQADLIWKTLFIDNSPVSEKQMGIIYILNKLGIDTSTKDLNEIRKYFKNVDLEEHIEKVLKAAKVKEVVMINDPMNDKERKVWLKTGNTDERFKSAISVDALLNNYKDSYKKLREMGYEVSNRLDEKSLKEIKRYLTEWIKNTGALYLSAVMPPDFLLPAFYQSEKIMKYCVIPVCKEFNLPFVMIIGIKRGNNTKSGEFTDFVAKGRVAAVEYMCRAYPQNKFIITMAARENQYELINATKRFKNLYLFGCGSDLSGSNLIEETTKLRMESLGLAFIPQYSDAKVLEQLIYIWGFIRKNIASLLIEKYKTLLKLGWEISEKEIKRDVETLFNNNFKRMIKE